MPEVKGNKAVEDAAIAWVTELERRAGREPRDMRYEAQFPADLTSPPRMIEVKAFGTSTRGSDLWLETKQVEEALRNPQFFVYVVENVRQGDPSRFTIKVLGGARLARLLERAKEQRYFTVPWPVADYDSAPGDVGQEPATRLPVARPAPTAEQPAQPGDPVAEPRTAVDPADYTIFKDDDRGFLAWQAANPTGFVLNIQRTYNPSDARLHRADCYTINGTPARGSTWTGPYVKVCSTKIEVLDRWARAKNLGPIRRCGACNP